MKKINRIIVSLLAVLPVLGSCAEEIIEKGAPENTDSYGVYFETLTTAQKSIELDPSDPTTLTFKVFRTKEKGSAIVPIQIRTVVDGEVDEDIFTASGIAFDDGQTETTFDVKFPKAEIGTPYTCQVECTDPKYVFTYSTKPTAFSFTVTRVKWNLVTGPNGEEYGSWTDDIMSSMYGFSQLYACNDKIKIYERADMPGFYRINDVYNPYMLAQFWANEYADEEFEENCTAGTINYINATDPTAVYLPYQTTGAIVNSSEGYIEFASKVAEVGFKDTAEYGTMVNGVIKFPVDGIMVNFTILGGWYAGNNSGKTVIVFPGCKDNDFSLDVDADLSSEGAVPVHFSIGADLDKVLYAAYEGVVAEADIHTKALEVFRDKDALVAESEDINITFEKTGKYTIVAVGVDADGGMQAEASVVATCVAADDEVPVVLSCGIGSAAKYKPQGVSTDNAVEFYVYGEDIVDAKISAVKKIDLVGNYNAAVAALLKSKSVSADNLKAINEDGFVGYIGKLLPGTEYYLMVYASNGYEEEIFVTETSETTTGDPLPIYQSFTYDDVDDDHAAANAAALAGKYNFYAINAYGSLGMREYISKVTISDTGEKEGPDDDGLYDEYIGVKGIFSKAAAVFGFDDTIVMDYYGGVAYSLTSGFGAGSGNYASYYFAPMVTTSAGKLYRAVDYALLGVCVADGYIAFLPSSNYASQGYEFTGYYLGIYTDSAYSSFAGGAKMWYQDILLVAEGKDNNGVAPKAAATASIALQPVLDELQNMPSTYIQPEKDRIRKAIDKAKSKLLWGEISSVEGSRECSKADFTVSEGTPSVKAVAGKAELKANLRKAVIR